MVLIKDYYIQYFRPYLLLLYHYTVSVPGYSNMEVLTSTNRMSATTFLSLYLSSKYGTKLHFYVTGLADNNSFHGFFITNFITIVFLILCSIPFCVQLVTVCDKLCKLYFSKYFTSVFKKIHCVLHTLIGLYRVASQCRQFCAFE